jgi:alkanesulfonate monooxygenase SsuD/methylene tetrahydromethanopterin reductase-like flavin-dependent oxidoreductase (luciferase family)
MAAAVTDEMVDEMAIAGTPEECRAQLARYDGLLDHVLFYPPSFAVKAERVRENYQRIREVFGPANAPS